MSTRRHRDAGVTLVETLVAMTLFGMLGTVLIGFALGSSEVGREVRRGGNVNADARLTVERMTRELRQAQLIEHAEVDAQGRVVSLSVGVNLDDNSVIDTNAGSNERVTYRWDAASEKLSLYPTPTFGWAADPMVEEELLANKVFSADIRLRSSAWIYDLNGDGITTWQELDASSIGNRDNRPGIGGDPETDPELKLIDLVAVELQVKDGGVRRRFTVQADMRNRTDVS